jgi:peptidoglycan/LPS O-acetylase OafA/YrhL
VLSGFLITYLLQVEKDVQQVNIKKFYLRRILRIWPLYYAYLVLTVVTMLLFGLGVNINTLLLYIFYAANIPFILNTAFPLLIHYWSLGVEEQFYLFWPWVNKKLKSLVPFILIAVGVIIAAKLVLHFTYPNSVWETAIDVTRFHCMMIGALGAVWYKNRYRLFMRIADNKITQFICWVILLLVAFNQYHIASVLDKEIIAVVALLVIIGQIGVTNRLVNLETTIMDFLGRISYGIYVIHPLVLFFFAKTIGQLSVVTPVNYILAYSVILAATIFISHLSYNYFERPFLKFKKRFEVVKSSASREGLGVDPKEE